MLGADQHLLFGVERCLLLRFNWGRVCCPEVVRFSEGLLLEVLLYCIVLCPDPFRKNQKGSGNTAYTAVSQMNSISHANSC